MENNNSTFPIAIKTLAFLEPMLAKELQDLGATNIKEARRVVTCDADWELVYRANFMLRSALRVLIPIAEFNSRNADDLYKRCLNVDWEEYLDVEQTFAIEPNVRSSMYNHAHFASLKMKDAIADAFMKKHGKRPSVNPENPDVQFHLHIDEQRVSISLDSSGSSLNQRGYRVAGGKAPLNEVLAAGMVLHTGWKGECDFYDPMCGSGTLAIEAAMVGNNIPPQVSRKGFGFFNWKNFDKAIWMKVREEGMKGIKAEAVKIHASDTDDSQLKLARLNIAEAGLTDHIVVENIDFLTFTPVFEKAILVMNPPYGERLDDEEIKFLYKRIGDTMKHQWPGCDAWIISSNPEAMKCVGLRPSRKIPMMNGTLECRFQKYSMFAGKKSDMYKPKEEAN